MITVFTPVYNRAYIIENLYQSLLKQTSNDFEWIIIDDGSTDFVEELIDSWIQAKTAPFKIRFFRQENGGKHRAINKGVQLAEGEAFFIVDSDDYLVEEAIEAIHKWWKDIEEDDSYAGVAGLRGNRECEIIGDIPLFESYIDATNIERAKYGLLGDKAEVYKTSILKKYPFPEFEGENFLTEAIVWDRIGDDGLKIRWFYRVIYICEYREDGLTSKGKQCFVKNPAGWGLYIQQKSHFFHLTVEEKMAQYLEYYIFLKESIDERRLRENLGLEEEMLREIKIYCKACIEKTIQKIGKRVALYGVGERGKKVLELYRHTEVEVCFVIDREWKETACRQIVIGEPCPVVDAIIVTPKAQRDEIFKLLAEKTTNRLIGYDEWKAYIGLDKSF